MKKVGILTFHASHNYGSMLQAYALKKVISLFKGVQCEVINYRTEKQKDLYAVLTKRKGVRYFLKNAYAFVTYNSQKTKWQLFENFLTQQLNCGQEKTIKDIADANFDIVVTGSDQIWNINATDFDEIYLGKGINTVKLAYAVSCGTHIVEDAWLKNDLKQLFSEYKAISVRDRATADFARKFGVVNPSIVCDPTMLLSRDEWDELSRAPKQKLPDKYIFLYTLSCTKELVSIANNISETLGIPIVISKVTNQYDMVMRAKKVLACGPQEFLYLLKNAQLVLTTSYHAMLFSLMYNKKFFVVNGSSDNRHREIVERFGLDNNLLSVNMTEQEIMESYDSMRTDYSGMIQLFAQSSKDFLERNI